MSLLSEAFEPCVMIDKTTRADGYGGYVTEYVGGAEFECAIVFDTSMEARKAEQAGVSSVYTITTHRNLTLEYHDIIRRLRDSKIFRITSDGDDKYTPKSATLDMRQVTAEEWSLPNGQGTGNT